MLHQIGAGALGPVFRAYDPRQEKLAAVKLFRLDLPPDRAHRLVREFEALIALDLTHPAIVAPLATGISGTSAFLVQEFVAAESLDIVVRNYGPAPLDEVVRVTTLLAGALDYAAVVGVRHGALHPRDVLVSPEEARLTGLGVAQALERIDAPAPVRRPYTAPERIAGRPWDHRADIFSLAALIFELVSGKRIAGTGENAAAALTSVAGVDPEATQAMKAAFSRALAEDPAARHESALRFAEELTAAVQPAATVLVDPEKTVPSLPVGDTSSSDDTIRDEPPRSAVEDEDRTISMRPDSAAASVADVDLRDDETIRYTDVEPVPVVAAAAAAEAPPPAPVHAPISDRFLRDEDLAPMPESAPAARRALPIAAAALAAGLAVGFIAGRYTDVFRPLRGVDTSTEQVATDAAVQPPPAPSAREFTESAVPADRAPTTLDAPSPVATSPVPDTAATPPARVRERTATARPSAQAVRPAPAAAGRLLVRSSPSGARVTVNGRDVGVTPVTVRELTPGAHTVRVAREGYRAEERRVTLTAARPAQSLTFELERPSTQGAPASAGIVSSPAAAAPEPPAATMAAGRYTGVLQIESRPAGATVVLDGKTVGTTPLAISDVAAGSHAVRLELAGYNRWTASVRVVAGERNRIAASLER